MYYILPPKEEGKCNTLMWYVMGDFLVSKLFNFYKVCDDINILVMFDSLIIEVGFRIAQLEKHPINN